MAEPDSALKSSFAPVADAGARLLILGSLPGEASLRKAQYYGNARNQFWRLMATVLGREIPADYETRLQTLREAGVALWDVVGAARRIGSLDANIRGHRPNRLRELIVTLPRLEAVAFNGGAASAIGRRTLGEAGPLALITLPSSSPAYTLAFERKAEVWAQLRRFLER
jgi:hypoxanthine-DNA glycosylase